MLFIDDILESAIELIHTVSYDTITCYDGFKLISRGQSR
jgi:hypothetical protein